MYMPVPATNQAMMAPNGPVAVANLPGRLKMPAPTIEPTTIPVNAKGDSFCSDLSAMPTLQRHDHQPQQYTPLTIQPGLYRVENYCAHTTLQLNAADGLSVESHAYAGCLY